MTGDKYVVESTATGAAFLSKFFDNLRSSGALKARGLAGPRPRHDSLRSVVPASLQRS